ncbi:hypothetical protein FHL15_003093 [Xylaria flabelliformis]|uniref:Glucose-methanol-choline oxidoreductase N-terminal domain-containing protein n=1 Tax=Xylaria flabelliformis TaxID=2512241 RepID=A0A553I6W7_9PEZI|nr:hypothetical protein FHL15_003093 [Xylaria flabelliformis]
MVARYLLKIDKKLPAAMLIQFRDGSSCAGGLTSLKSWDSHWIQLSLTYSEKSDSARASCWLGEYKMLEGNADLSAAGQEYDYVVVGSGPSGVPLAVDLAKAGSSVPLLEAGADLSGEPTYSETYEDIDSAMSAGPVVDNAVLELPPDATWDYIANITGDKPWAASEMTKIFEEIENSYYVNNGTKGRVESAATIIQQAMLEQLSALGNMAIRLQGFSVNVTQANPEKRRFSPSDVNFLIFEKGADQDLQAMLEAVSFVGNVKTRIGNSSGLVPIEEPSPCPSTSRTCTGDGIKVTLKKQAYSRHATGTCATGDTASDPMTMLASEFRVKGVDRFKD